MSDRASCIATTAELVIDGANGVCADARDGAGAPLTFAELAPVLGLMVLGAVMLWLRKRRRAPIAALGLMLAAAALPGTYAALAWRADRPAEVRASVAPIERLHDGIRAFADEHDCAELVRSECLACEPIARLALVDRRCNFPAPIEIHADALEAGCIDEGGRLRCGNAPAGDGAP